MASVREQARGVLRRLALPIPERERTLRVIVPKGTVPADGHRCLCAVPAMYAWRAAHENGCTQIVVEDGTGHRHAFDTIDLVRAQVRRGGFLPAVGRVPRLLATNGHRALGNTFDVSRPMFTVAASVSGSTPAEPKE